MKRTTGLGRGLDALIDTHVITDGSSSINEVDITQIYANPDQPRHSFDEEALQELSDSIREHGVISPITLRKNEDGTYMIIAGERRFRASKMAGLTSIPAYIRTAKDEEVREWALIENIQREDLDAIEIALAYQRLACSNCLPKFRWVLRRKRLTWVMLVLFLVVLPPNSNLHYTNVSCPMVLVFVGWNNWWQTIIWIRNAGRVQQMQEHIATKRPQWPLVLTQR